MNLVYFFGNFYMIPIFKERACNGCSACCEGALHGQAHGHAFWKGRPCHFLGKNCCTIYENRPDDPCKSFKCGYLIFEWMPEWMRPDLSGVIVTSRITEKNKIPYIEVVESQGKMKAEVLSFLFMSYMNGQLKNFTYQIDGGVNRIGGNDFLAEFSSIKV